MSKFFNIYLKLITILLCHQVLMINAAKTRIVGGAPTTREYIVALRKTDGTLFCGGSLVHKNYVVTAAHCVIGGKPSDLNVLGGVTYLDQVGEQRSVERIIIPKAYKKETYHMDVAVLKLSSPMEGPNIATIGLCDHEIHDGNEVIASGWGVTKENSTTPSNQLMKITLNVVSPVDCSVKYREILPVSNSMMCASARGLKDTCDGDAGGPLEHNGQLCGIISFGIGCGRLEYPGVYTNVNQVKGFINQVILH